MPHLHLPAAHSDTDLALAADVAAAVGSRDLYVVWSHAEGAGLAPEVDAVLREDDGASPFTDLVAAIFQGIGALWRAILQGPAPGPAEQASGSAARQPAARERRA
jgi:hypothetical protein